MENNYNFDLNPRDIDSSDIQKHKNFEGVLQQFQQIEDPNQEPTPRKPFLKAVAVGVAAIAAAVLGFFMFSTSKNEASNVNETPLTVAKVVAAPIKGLEKTFTNYEIDVTNGGVITYPTGSTLTIPDHAFVKPNGTPATGKINVRYREYHDAVDIFLAGIPMNYDSAGVKYQLESAGMMEVYADQSGEALTLAKDKSLDMALKSDIKKEVKQAYNIYVLDPKSKGWIFKTTDNIEKLSETKLSDISKVDSISNENSHKTPTNSRKSIQLKTEVSVIDAEIKQLQIEAPAKPQKPSGNDFVFDINFDGINYLGGKSSFTQSKLKENQTDINNLKKQLYQGAMWKLVGNAVKLPSDYSNTKWDDIDVTDNGKNIFTMTLKKGEKEIKFDVTPVLIGKNYDKAMAEYEKRFTEFQAKIVEKETKKADFKQNIEKELAFEAELENKTTSEKVAILKANGYDNQASEVLVKEQVINHFKVTNLGMWNCDRPLDPDFLMVKSNLKGQNNESYDGLMAFMVSKSKNTVSSFYADKDKELFFNPSLDYTLWVVTPDNKLALYTSAAFMEMKKKNLKAASVVDFVLTKIEQPLNTESDVRRILGY